MTIYLFPFPFVLDLPKFLYVIGFFIAGHLTAVLIKSSQIAALKRLSKEQSTRIAALDNELAGMRADHINSTNSPLTHTVKDAA